MDPGGRGGTSGAEPRRDRELTARCAHGGSKLRPMRRLAVIVVLVLALAAPAAALAQNGSGSDVFGPLPTAPTPTPVPTVQTSTSSSDDTSRTTLYVIAAGLLVIFLVIGRVIFSDARRHLPGASREGGPALREAGPHKHAKHAKQRARAKGKAQKAARRRNR